MDHYYENGHSVNHLFFELLTINLACSCFTYLGILALCHFCTDLAVLGSYCHDLGQIFPSTAFKLS